MTLNGKPLPRLGHAGDTPHARIMTGDGSHELGTPQSSLQGRLPLHLGTYRFSKPGTYMVRYKGHGKWFDKLARVIFSYSDWTPLIVKPFSPEQRGGWLEDQISHPPDNVGVMLGILTCLRCLRSPMNRCCQSCSNACIITLVIPPGKDLTTSLCINMCLNVLDYYGDDVIRREIPR